MVKTIYIGYSIDMDAPDIRDKFEEGCNNLLKFFEELNCLNSCTWLINHNKAYDTLGMHPKLMEKIYTSVKNKNGCIGLHTHFNSSCYNPPPESKCPLIPGVTRGGWTKMQEDKTYWYDDGLRIPKQQIENFIKEKFNDNYIIECFKAGNHMRNHVMFESLIKLGFKYDCTCGYEVKREYVEPISNKKYTVYDDSNTLVKDGPFMISNEDGKLLEIPELPSISKLRNFKKLSNKNFYYLYQIHPDEVAKEWDKQDPKDKRNIIISNIDYIKKVLNNYKIEFINMKDMGELIILNKEYHMKTIKEI